MNQRAQHALMRAIAVATFAAFCTGCTTAAFGPTPNTPGSIGGQARHSARWIPAVGTSYQIEYQYPGNHLNTRVPAQIYDIDMFDSTPAMVSALHRQGRRAVCYIDVGTWENWRPDAGKFPKKVLGKPDGGWPGERWLDIRQTSILEPIMGARFALCKSKNFDAVDPDNIDGYENNTGFPLTSVEQLTYDIWVAQAVHAQGLAVAQKNDNDQIAELARYFDYAVVEQCFVQGWCKQFERYTHRNRLVVDVEYGLSNQRFLQKACPSDAAFHELAILKHLSLNPWIVTCHGEYRARR
jgi:hypothetical protein